MKKQQSFSQDNNYRNQINDLVLQESDRLKEVYKDLHQNPELGFMEIRTSGIVAKELENNGYKVIKGLGKTGVVGILNNGEGPVVMYRADMDCNSVKEVTGLEYASTKTVKKDDGTEVPVMHACGHDAHTTWLIGVAKTMAELKDKWQGTLILLAQPAEELIEGAAAMVKEGMYEKGVPVPDYLIGAHTVPFHTGYVSIEKGSRMAGTDQIDVTFYGIGGHGSSPQFAKDPVLMAASAIIQYQFIISRAIDPQEAAVLTVGSVQAGSDNNVIPSSALLKINLRWFKESDRELMIEGIKRINDSIALAYDLPKELYPTIKLKGYGIPLINDSTLVDQIYPVIEEIVGKDSIIHGLPQTMGSEDFPLLVKDHKKVKTAYIYLGTAKPEDVKKAQKEGKLAPYFNHNGDYRVDLEAIPIGVKMMSSILFEVFSS